MLSRLIAGRVHHRPKAGRRRRLRCLSTRPADIHAIRDVVAFYCRGVDRLDLDLVARPTTLTVSTTTPVSTVRSMRYVRVGGQERLEFLSGTMHFIGNHHVDFVGADIAISETYFDGNALGPTDEVSRPTSPPALDTSTLWNGGMVAWAIAERWAVREWTRPDVFVAPERPGPRGRRDADDPLSVLLKRFGL